MLRLAAVMSHGGGSGSCTSVSLGKLVRRALSGRKRVKDKGTGGGRHLVEGCVSSVELIGGSSTSAASAAARRESVVRVVLSSGVVEVYAGVVLACTVIRKHPPGLCLAHPDVFRNPHGARVRPLEPLFPGQKFFLLPETTIEKLQRNIPEGSVGAFADDDDEDEGGANDEDEEASSSSSSLEGQDHGPPGWCGARDYFVDRERWAEWHFKNMVARGLAVEQSAAEPDKAKKRRQKKPKDVVTAPPSGAGCRNSRTTRTWEPSLPSVEEEEMPSSPLPD